MVSVSVIVPIYNAGRYLTDCLRSLQAQSLPSIEFILVLDCPSDGSDLIARQFAANDPRFVVISNDKNLHIGNSRNRGIESAKGEYIAFCDHDDILTPDGYEQMYKAAKEHQAQYLITQPVIDRNGIIEQYRYSLPNNSQSINDTVLQDLLAFGGKTESESKYCFIHNILYSRSFLYQHHIRFVNTNLITNEDVVFNIETLLHHPYSSFLPQHLYTHRLISTSSGHQDTYLAWDKRFNELEYIYSLLITNHFYTPPYNSYFWVTVQKKIIDELINLLRLKHDLPTFIKAYRQAKQYPFLRDAFRHYSDQRPRTPFKQLLRQCCAYLLTL
ncbi:MAG: glycosyltransferase family 2 protein [Paludibacteraceae bacterium]|nr:glycosyltransferase family 2 protein [Paludibacteraceae bacterium]